MNVKLYLLIFMLPSIFLGCNGRNELKNFYLSHVNASIKLPGCFKTVNENDISKIIYKSQDLAFRTELLNFISNNTFGILLIDTLNPYRFIFIVPITPYAEIDSNLFYVTIKHERGISSKQPESDSTYYVGSKMGSIRNFKFIESKYQRGSKNSGQRVGNSFIISSDKKTIGIGFYSTEEQDVMKYISTIE